MRGGGFCWCLPRGRGASLAGGYLHWSTSFPFVWFCSGAHLWVWLLRWPTVFPLVLREAVKCLRWFWCVSVDRETWRWGRQYCRIKSCRKRWQGKHIWKKKSQIKQTGNEIALLAAKEIVCKTYYFSAQPISTSLLNLLSVHTICIPPPSLPTPSITQVWIVRRLRGFSHDVLLCLGPGTAR